MKKFLGMGLAVLMSALPLAAMAQEDGAVGEDAAVVADAAVAVDTGVVVDAGTTTDAATTADAAAGCGNVTYFGTCDGNVLSYCNDGELEVATCATGETCGLWDCTEGIECLDITVQATCTANTECGWSASYEYCYPKCWGYECLAAPGDDCDPSALPPCQASAGYGCLNGVCATSTTCTEDTAETCTGTYVNFCMRGTLSNSDCSGGGQYDSTCAVPPNDTTSPCVGLEGYECGSYEGVDYVCAAGLTCNTSGICSSGSTTDAGTGTDATRRDTGSSSTDSASGDDDDDDTTGCGCTATRAGSSAALILAGLLGLALVRRRR